MSISQLTVSLEALTKQESDFASTESAVIKLLGSDKLSQQLDLSALQVDDLVTLVESVTNLRRLIHTRLRQLLLELRDQQVAYHSERGTKSQVNVSTKSHDAPEISGSELNSATSQRDRPSEARIERHQPTPKPLLFTEEPAPRKTKLRQQK